MRNAHFGEHRESIKRALSNHGNSLGHGHLFQVFRHVGRVRLVSARAKDITEPSNLIVLKGGTDERNGDLDHFSTLGKRTDANDQFKLLIIRNCNGGQLVAHKCVSSNVIERLGQSKLAGKSRIGKGIVVNALELACLGNRQAIDLFTTVERKLRNLHDAIGQNNIRKILTTVERTLVNTAQAAAVGKGHLGQTLTVRKRVVIDRHHAGGNLNLCQRRAEECPIAEGENIGILKEVHTRQLAILKRAKSNDLDARGNGQFARSARRSCDQLSAVLGDQQTVYFLIIQVVCGHLEPLQVRECHECVFSNKGNVGGNGQRLQA